MKRNKIFFVRLKPYEPNCPNHKFKPSVIKGLVYANDDKAARKRAIDEMKPVLNSVFPTADLKVLDCKKMNVDFSVVVN